MKIELSEMETLIVLAALSTTGRACWRPWGEEYFQPYEQWEENPMEGLFTKLVREYWEVHDEVDSLLERLWELNEEEGWGSKNEIHCGPLENC